MDVRLRGTSGALGQVSGTDLVAVIDLRGARPGRRLFHILPDDINVPAGIMVLQISPSTLSLTFEASAIRTVPVVPDIDDEPAPGFEVHHVSANPATVQISGPYSAVQAVTEATTEPISVRGATKSVIDTVTIGIPDSDVRLRDTHSAVVTVDIRPMPIERVVEHVPVQVRNLASRLRASASPQEVTVHLRGAASAVAALKPADLSVFADVSGLSRGRYNLPVRFDQPHDATIVRVEPSEADVRVR